MSDIKTSYVAGSVVTLPRALCLRPSISYLMSCASINANGSVHMGGSANLEVAAISKVLHPDWTAPASSDRSGLDVSVLL